MSRKAIVLVNVGTPDKPTVKSVRKYLSEFLNDKYVIDIPWLLQKILVNLIIVPFRAPKSTKLYKQLWTSKGSPLLFYLHQLSYKVQEIAGDNYKVYGAMRYGNPSIKKVFDEIKKEKIEEVIVFPLYPQYATSTTQTTIEKIKRQTQGWLPVAKLKFIEQFYNHESFLSCFAERIKSYYPDMYDHIVFSYHGLPVRQINKMHPAIKEKDCDCQAHMPSHGSKCYKATCYQTTRLLAERLGLSEDKYTVSFQSRLSNNWLLPFTDQVLEEKAKQGVKNILVVAPAFVADCLETTIEIGFEYKELFEDAGGNRLTLVKSLNSSDDWARSVFEICSQSMAE